MALTPEEQVELESLQAGSAPATATDSGKAFDTAKGYASNALGALGKMSGSLRALTTGPLTGLILEGVTGKKAFDKSDIANAVDPHNLKQFPSNAEMFEKTGVKNPLLSDAVPGYAKKGSQHPWYQPEKGGMLDPGIAGALQMGTDPAMWTGAGEGALAARGMGAASKALGVVDSAVNPLSMITRYGGKKMYEAPLLPIEQQGARKGKEAIAETLYKGGVKTPFNLPEKAQGIVDDLMGQRDEIFTQAENAGGVASMQEAVAPLRARIAEIRASKDPLTQPIADKMEEKLESYLAAERGVPGTPPTVKTVSSPIVDETGQPFTHEVTTPGSPAVPGKVFTPGEASSMKSSIYRTQPKTHYDVAGTSDFESELDGLLAQGQLSASQSAVGRSMGPRSAAEVQRLNENAGNLLSTQKAQATVTERAQRQAHQMREISPADVITGVVGAASMGGPKGALEALAIKKAAGALNLARMPVGYYSRKLGETRILDRLNQIATSKKGSK